MFSLTKGPLAAIVIGSALLTVACGEGGTEMEQTPFAATTPDTGIVSVVDAGAVDAAPPVIVPVVDAGPRDSGGNVVVVVDSSTPSPDSGAPTGDAGPAADGGPVVIEGDGGTGECCPDGKCLCHGPKPTALTNARGPYTTASYSIAGTGCVYHPTGNAPGPFAAVAISDGFIGGGGCGPTQTNNWGPLYASWGIVAMIVETGELDDPATRGRALTKGIAAFKTENTKSGSPLNGKMSGRYGTSGFSMGGGGTSFASQADKTLLTSVAIMPYGPVRSGVTTPTLVICGSSDMVAPCSGHGIPLYNGIGAMVPKMRVQVSSGHAGQPGSGGGRSGQYGLAFQKVFLENDLRWRPLLVAAMSEATNIK